MHYLRKLTPESESTRKTEQNSPGCINRQKVNKESTLGLQGICHLRVAQRPEGKAGKLRVAQGPDQFSRKRDFDPKSAY
ncbi:hypothetical protein A2U01_0052557 [Trifolium medium]|uniref:Uncharacterized protein n=1 Tax=Trifolium medium TaxID=97028 RepID=A0A392R733_9FABA|nr:hypothetical protein [Trifolium medium]